MIKKCKRCKKDITKGSKTGFCYPCSCKERIGKYCKPKPHCKTCGIEISRHGKRCASCAGMEKIRKHLINCQCAMCKDKSGEKSPSFKTGKYTNNKTCLICNCHISKSAKYCNKHKWINKKSNKNYCKICKQIIAKYNKTDLCRSCSKIGVKRPDLGIRNLTLLPRPHWMKYGHTHVRSSWEYLFARWLRLSNIKWRYEPKTFLLKETSYTPDFYLPESDTYIEIKGYFSPKCQKKIKLFRKIYPNINLLIFGEKIMEQVCL